MKKIGIIGGLSRESSSAYYLNITRKTNQFLGGYQTAEIIMLSINPDEIILSVHENKWDKVAFILIKAAKQLEKMGADCIIIPCNTLHKVINEIQNHISIPVLNILDCIGEYSQKNAFSKLGLLGTKFTMEENFYRDHLYNHFKIVTEIPSKKNREKLHDIIFNELCYGIFNKSSKIFLIKLCMDFFKKNTCDAIILGCTELPLLIQQKDIFNRLIDTTQLHSEYAVKFAIENIAKKVA